MDEAEKERYLNDKNGRIGYYDKEGKRLSLREWCELYEMPDYKIVARTNLASGWTVSTVWLGLDHSFLGDPNDPGHIPIIFETMFFCEGPDGPGGLSLFDDYQVRYATLEQALEGHEEAVKYARSALELREEELHVDAEPE